MLTKIIENATLFFILMPYVGLGFLPSDTQPFALIFSVVMSAAWIIKDRNVPIQCLPILPFLILPFIAVFLSTDKELLVLLRALAAHSTPFFVFVFSYFYFKNRKRCSAIKVLDFCLAFIILGFFLNAIGATSLIQIFVNRGVFEESLHARGFTSFFPEQSRVSEQLSFLLICYILLGGLSVKRFSFIFLSAALSFSGQFFVILLFLLISFAASFYMYSMMINKISRRNFYLLIISPPMIILFYFLMPFFLDLIVSLGMPARGAVAFKNLLLQGGHGLSNDVGAIIKLTGFVLVLAVLIDKPFNFELASASNIEFWQDIIHSYSAIQQFIFGNERVITSPYVYSSIGTWIVDFGVLGFVSSVSFLYMVFRKSLLSKNVYFIFCFFFTSIMALIKLPLANPTIWLVFALIIVASKKEQHKSLY